MGLLEERELEKQRLPPRSAHSSRTPEQSGPWVGPAGPVSAWQGDGHAAEPGSCLLRAAGPDGKSAVSAARGPGRAFLGRWGRPLCSPTRPAARPRCWFVLLKCCGVMIMSHG